MHGDRIGDQKLVQGRSFAEHCESRERFKREIPELLAKLAVEIKGVFGVIRGPELQLFLNNQL